MSGDNGNHLYIDDINLSDEDVANSVEEINLDVSIYPNPTQGSIFIQANHLITDSELVIFDQFGREVKKVSALRLEITRLD